MTRGRRKEREEASWSSPVGRRLVLAGAFGGEARRFMCGNNRCWTVQYFYLCTRSARSYVKVQYHWQARRSRRRGERQKDQKGTCVGLLSQSRYRQNDREKQRGRDCSLQAASKAKKGPGRRAGAWAAPADNGEWLLRARARAREGPRSISARYRYE